MDIVTSSIAQGLLWSVMAIGVYLTFRILDIADMTAEGSFPLGAAITAQAIVSGVGPVQQRCWVLPAGLLQARCRVF